jgi:hypothetical protein
LLLIPVFIHEDRKKYWPDEKKLVQKGKLRFQLYEMDYETSIKNLPNFGIDTREGCQAEEKGQKDKKLEGGSTSSDRIWPVVNPDMSKNIIYENEYLIFEGD